MRSGSGISFLGGAGQSCSSLFLGPTDFLFEPPRRLSAQHSCFHRALLDKRQKTHSRIQHKTTTFICALATALLLFQSIIATMMDLLMTKLLQNLHTFKCSLLLYSRILTVHRSKVFTILSTFLEYFKAVLPDFQAVKVRHSWVKSQSCCQNAFPPQTSWLFT